MPPEDIWKEYVRGTNFVAANVLEMRDRNSLLSHDYRQQCHTQIKELMNNKVLPTLAAKVRNYEHTVKSTKKGFTNYFKNAFKKKERNENEGLRDDFLMNSSEKSMKNLVDLSFLTQDYKTVLAYVKYSYNEFKSIKAHKHASSCSELQFLCYVMIYENYMDTKEYSANIFEVSNSYTKCKDYRWLMRNLIVMAQLSKAGNKYEQAAKCYLRLAYSFLQSSSSSIYSALFFEQAAFAYLKIDQQRKFNYYLVQAGIIYEALGFKSNGFF